jgi:hypothetical protein
MHTSRLFALLLGIGGSSFAHADQAELFVSERAAQAGYVRPIGLSATDASVAGFFNEDTDLMVNGGLITSGAPAGQLPLTFGAGARAYLFSLDDADEEVLSAALGGRVGYTIPANIPLLITVEGFYAPEILTTEGENMLDLIARFEVEFIPRTLGFIGYRLFEVDLEDRDEVQLDDNIHVGLRLSF